MRIRIRATDTIASPQGLRSLLQKPLVIISRHAQINIIIQGMKPPWRLASQQRSRIQKIGNVMLAAHTIDIL